MSKWPYYIIIASALLISLIVIISTGNSGPKDPNTEVPAGDPPFPSEKRYGIVDPHHYLKQDTIDRCMVIIEGLKKDGLMEMVVLIQEGVINAPQDYATHYGRYILLGEKGKDNGFVWLIRPDVRPEDYRTYYSRGRGLPKITASDLQAIMWEAAFPINSGNFDAGVEILVTKTAEAARD